MLLPGPIDVLEDCSSPERLPGLRFQAAMLRRSLDDLLETVAEDFAQAPASDTAEALIYRRDHLWE